MTTIDTNKYNKIIELNAAKFGLDSNLIKALIMTESSFKERAYRFEPKFYERYILNKPRFINHKYYDQPKIIAASYGLCQVMMTTFEEYGFKIIDIEDLYNPVNNILIGSKILSSKIKKYGLLLGILAYNSGSPRGKIATAEANFVYLKKVAKYYKQFNGQNQTILEILEN